MNFSGILRDRAKTDPDAIAYVRTDGGALTYADLEALVDAFARRALDTGVRPGERIAVALMRDLPVLAAILALARIGAVSVNRLDPAQPCDRCLAAPAAGPSTSAPTTVVRRDWFIVPPVAARLEPLQMHEGDRTVCRYFTTSGTTGSPKLVPLTHEQVAGRVMLRRRAVPMQGQARLLSMIRPHSGYGLQVALRVLAEGATIVEAPLLAQLPETIVRERVDHLVLSPGILAPLVAQLAPGEGPFPGLRAVEVSGGLLTEALARVATERVSPHLNVLYGSTEAGVIATAPLRDVAGRPGMVGYVATGIDVEVIDDHGVAQPPGTDGALRFRSATVAVGYVDGSGSTSTFRDGWFHSGDFGRVDVDGALTMAGRIDERINVGGDKRTPESIEDFALGLPGVADAVAFAFPSALGIDRVAMAIVTGPGFDFEAFRTRCATGLGMFSPEIVLRMAVIPRNENGKPLRRELARRLPPAPGA